MKKVMREKSFGCEFRICELHTRIHMIYIYIYTALYNKNSFSTNLYTAITQQLGTENQWCHNDKWSESRVDHESIM